MELSECCGARVKGGFGGAYCKGCYEMVDAPTTSLDVSDAALSRTHHKVAEGKQTLDDGTVIEFVEWAVRP